MNRPTFLAKQYGQPGNLNARISLHSRFSTNPYGWFREVFARLAPETGATVLEVSCGTGQMWQSNAARIPPDCAITLTDFSEGMLREARGNLDGRYPGFRFEVAPAQALPFPDHSFDMIVANHISLAVYEDSIEVAEAEPLAAAYVGSLMWEGTEFSAEQLAAFCRFVAGEIDRHGPVLIRKSQGMFEARRCQ